MNNIHALLILMIVMTSCASLPRRVYDQEKMKLDTEKTENVALWKVDDYVSDVMEHAKGYEEPDGESASDMLVWLYVWISGIMFVAGFGCFAVAALTHMYKANIVGFFCLIGAGVAAGFAEIAGLWWTIPAACVIGVVIWLVTHRTKNFSIVEWFKRSKNGNN